MNETGQQQKQKTKTNNDNNNKNIQNTIWNKANLEKKNETQNIKEERVFFNWTVQNSDVPSSYKRIVCFDPLYINGW